MVYFLRPILALAVGAVAYIFFGSFVVGVAFSENAFAKGEAAIFDLLQPGVLPSLPTHLLRRLQVPRLLGIGRWSAFSVAIGYSSALYLHYWL